MKVHIVRHAETEANDQHRLQGHDDTPLTQTGKQNVEEVGRVLDEYDYDCIFSSPFKRALDTAKLIAQQLEIDIRIAPELKEICYGDWEGQPKEELQEIDEWRQREQDKYNFQHPGEFNDVQGQSYADIFERVTGFFDQLIESNREFVLLVTHLGVLRNAKKYFEDCSDEKAVSFTPDVRQVYEIDIEDDNVNSTILDMN